MDAHSNPRNSEEEGAPQDNDKGDGSDYNEAPEKVSTYSVSAVVVVLWP